MKRCKGTTPGGYAFPRGYPCENRAKFGDFCGVHSPEKKAARAKARGPTQFERDQAAINRRVARDKLMEDVIREAKRVKKAHPELNRALVDLAVFDQENP